MRIIKQISINHDEKVLTWRDELFHFIENPPPSDTVSDIRANASTGSVSVLAVEY